MASRSPYNPIDETYLDWQAFLARNYPTIHELPTAEDPSVPSAAHGAEQRFELLLPFSSVESPRGPQLNLRTSAPTRSYRATSPADTAARKYAARRHWYSIIRRFKTAKMQSETVLQSHFQEPHSVGVYQEMENRRPTPPNPGNPNFGASVQTRNVLSQEQLIFDAGKRDLFYTFGRRKDVTSPKTAVLNIAMLQHMALHQIQHRLAVYVAEMYNRAEFSAQLPNLPSLHQLLKDYCEAVQQLDLMSQCAARGYDKDPFLVKSSRTLERKILEDTGLVPDHVLPHGPLPLPLDHKEPQLRRTGRNEAHRAAHEKRRLLRFTMAAAGGVLLMVPVIIMSTVPGLISSLVTTCVSTLIFAFLVAWRTDFGPNEVLATTAAYAAVLVVFVGTSLSPRTNSS